MLNIKPTTKLILIKLYTCISFFFWNFKYGFIQKCIGTMYMVYGKYICIWYVMVGNMQDKCKKLHKDISVGGESENHLSIHLSYTKNFASFLRFSKQN